MTDLTAIIATDAELEDWGPKPLATSGQPRESGIGELMHFVSGHGWIVDADGRWEITPGATRWFPDGWSGRWEVDVTVRKVFAIVKTQDAS